MSRETAASSPPKFAPRYWLPSILAASPDGWTSPRQRKTMRPRADEMLHQRYRKLQLIKRQCLSLCNSSSWRPLEGSSGNEREKGGVIVGRAPCVFEQSGGARGEKRKHAGVSAPLSAQERRSTQPASQQNGPCLRTTFAGTGVGDKGGGRCERARVSLGGIFRINS